LTARPFNWEWLGQEAGRHGILALVHRNLRESHADCPPELLKNWQIHAAAQRLENLRRCAELVTLQAELQAADVPALPFKGPVLAAKWYGDVGLRAFVDLDILVHPADGARAMDVLRRRGYHPAFRIDPAWEQPIFQAQGEMVFIRDKPPCIVDLHCQLLPVGYTFAVEPRDLWQRLAWIKLGGTVLPTLNAENTLVYFALHAAKHEWSNLRWLCDIAEILAQQTDLDWEYIAARMHELRCELLVHVSLHLAHVLLSAPLPPRWGPRSPQAGLRVRALALKAVRTRLFPPNERVPVLPDWPWQSLLFQGMQQPRDRWRLFYDTLLRPSALELRLLPLPLWAAPLYAIVRPLRLLAKHGLASAF
jgi:hypothetical protein